MKLNTTVLLGALTACTLALASPACGGDKKADKADAKKDEKKDAKKADKKAEKKEEKAEAKGDEGGGGGDKVGIAECDEYIEKYSKCIDDTMPEAGRAAAKSAFEQVVKGWKDMPEAAKAGLKDACTAAMEAAKAQCKW